MIEDFRNDQNTKYIIKIDNVIAELMAIKEIDLNADEKCLRRNACLSLNLLRKSLYHRG